MVGLKGHLIALDIRAATLDRKNVKEFRTPKSDSGLYNLVRKYLGLEENVVIVTQFTHRTIKERNVMRAAGVLTCPGSSG